MYSFSVALEQQVILETVTLAVTQTTSLRPAQCPQQNCSIYSTYAAAF